MYTEKFERADGVYTVISQVVFYGLAATKDEANVSSMGTSETGR